jgi:hypothetical protein
MDERVQVRLTAARSPRGILQTFYLTGLRTAVDWHRTQEHVREEITTST